MDTPEQLIRETQDFLAVAEKIQDKASPLIEQERKSKLGELEGLYRPWYHRALRLFADRNRLDLQQSFMKEYKGRFFHRIEKFLSLGWKVYDAELASGLVPKQFMPQWVTPYERSFQEPLQKQCDLLAALGSTSTITVSANADSGWNATFDQIREEIANSSIEKDLQDIALYDLEQARIAFEAAAYKASIVMLGAVLEGLMLGTIRRLDVLNRIVINPNPPQVLSQLGFKDPRLAAKVADKLGFEEYKQIIEYLMPDVEKLKVEGIQTFRNAIHPWETVKYPNIFGSPDQTRAIHHITSLAILSRFILSWTP